MGEKREKKSAPPISALQRKKKKKGQGGRHLRYRVLRKRRRRPSNLAHQTGCAAFENQREKKADQGCVPRPTDGKKRVAALGFRSLEKEGKKKQAERPSTPLKKKRKNSSWGGREKRKKVT